MKTFKQFNINLTGTNDVLFVLDVVKNNMVYAKVCADEQNGSECFVCEIYVNSEDLEKFYNKYPIFNNIGYNVRELEAEHSSRLLDDKKGAVDDLHEILSIYERFEKLYDRLL